MDRYGRVLVRKRCARCGVIAWVVATRSHCLQPRFGRGSYACYGDLERVQRKPKVDLTEEVQQMAEQTRAARRRPQDLAAKKLKHARKMVTKHTRALKRTMTAALHHWEKAVREYERKSSMTDAEVETARQVRKMREEQRAARSRRRGISLGSAP